MPIDDLVEQAMRRWPTVPAVYGWLRLDRRGRWLLIDRGRPGFDAARDGHGSEITSPPILDFLGRNYLCDAQGNWFWQNGPQRVFVELEAAPLILRVFGDSGETTLTTHTGYRVGAPASAWLDDGGSLYLQTELGPGVIHDLDLAQLDFDEGDPLPGALRLGTRWMPIRPTADAAAELGFRRRPSP